MKTAVVVFPGSNCDRDLAVALELVTGQKPAMLWHDDTERPEGLDLIALPGGSSICDSIRESKADPASNNRSFCKDGGGGWIRTSVGLPRRIYSPLHLTALPPLQRMPGRSPERAR